MGLRGQRINNNSTKYQEPELITGVEGILKMAFDKGLYSGDSLNIEEVIKTFPDIELREESMQSNYSGYFRNVNGKWIIGVNKLHHGNRKRYTLAHELGHYILHKDKNVDIVDTTFFRNNETDSIEYMANEFAAKLLMPEDKVRDFVDNQGIKNIGELAEKFEVSASAMKYRIISLGYKLKGNV
ncbi:MAG: ImmA/IrrE family metallo-endopeptidase [Prevotellaceae bacterium]|jgi:Zn-dependent peptidase ImmA (M78 family)|nr:ImmA/IrrE family metallo-endopeptidase [Prevotellaceae bacterium]